jgi:hypothetical protein
MSQKTLSIKLSLNDKQFMTGLRKASSSMKKFGGNLKKTGQNLTKNVTLPILGLGAAAVKLASDFDESLNKVNVAFGESSQEVQKFAKTTLQSFGIAEGSALEMASLFGDMATSMGLSQDEAANMSTSLVGLAGDLASFKNIGIEQAQTALAGVFTGETESLKKLGIVMTQANLESFALSRGMDSNVKSMTQAQKVALRYAFIMENTANAQGDFARTSDGFANQFRVLQESIKQLGEQFGKILLPIATKMVVKIQKFATAFSNLTEEQKETIVKVAGFAAALGPAIFFVGKIVTALGGLVTIIRALTLAMATNPIGAIATAIAAVVSGIIYLATSSSETAVKIRNFFRKIANGVIEAINKMIESINEIPGLEIKLIDTLELEEFDKEVKDTTTDVDNLTKSIKAIPKKTPITIERKAAPGRIEPKKTGLVPTNLSIPTELEGVEDIKPEGLESFSEAFFDFSEEFKATLLNTFSEISNLMGGVSNLFSQLHNKRITELDNEKAKEIENINNSLMSEEAKEKAINNINEKFARKKADADKKQAKRAKAMAILEATVATAAAVVKALPNIPLSIAAGVIGAAQIATIASTQIPAFADGGLVTGATLGLVGEGPGTSMSNPEVIAPLDKLKSMIGQGQGSVEVFGRISGSDILISTDRARKNRDRTRGY